MRVFIVRLSGFLAAVLVAGCAASSALPGTVPRPGESFDSGVVPFGSQKYQKVVLKTKPIAYFPLDNRESAGKKYRVKLIGGAKIKGGGAIASEKRDKALTLRGQAYATTSLSGGIPGKGSMVAWVDLSELPSTAGEYFYISGESQDGNDFDLQFENDNNLYFYTGSGENTEYTTDTTGLLNRWIMIAVTYTGGSNGFRNIYWNGSLVTPYHGTVASGAKTSQFNIGESTVFTGRYFQGRIDAVAIWNRPLTSQEIKAIYRSAGR